LIPGSQLSVTSFQKYCFSSGSPIGSSRSAKIDIKYYCNFETSKQEIPAEQSQNRISDFPMNTLYPLKFKPIFKDKIWGGHKVKNLFGQDFSPLSNCGESWVLSAYGEDISVVSNGFLAGNDINDLVEVYMGDLVGEKVYQKFGNKFPLLIKLVDANDWLSIQVHPDDEMAQRLGHPNGKTEMWYVVDADKDSELITGFNREISSEEYVHCLGNKTLKSILNFEKVKNGDVFFMPAGRVHAMGPGSLIAEIQQTSDLTYRIYDFDRVDEKGMTRELHTDLALQAIDFKHYDKYRNDYTPEFNKTVNLVNSEYFSTSLIHFGIPVVKDYSAVDSFVVLFCVGGSCIAEYNGGSEIVQGGELLLVPAETDQIKLSPNAVARILEIYVP
jgi:mannose-6-phosphate isomerase